MPLPIRQQKKPVEKPIQEFLFKKEVHEFEGHNPIKEQRKKQEAIFKPKHPLLDVPVPDGYDLILVNKKFPTPTHCMLYVQNHMHPDAVLFDSCETDDGGYVLRALIPELKGNK